MYIKSDEVDIPEARKALVERLTKDIKAAKKFFEDDFKSMIDDMERCWTGAAKNWPKDNYRTNVTQRHVRQKTSQLYAKNPKVQAKPRPKVEFAVWDGSPESLQQAQQEVAMAMNPMLAMQAMAGGGMPGAAPAPGGQAMAAGGMPGAAAGGMPPGMPPGGPQMPPEAMGGGQVVPFPGGAQPGMPPMMPMQPSPESIAILQEVEMFKARHKMLKRLGKTMENLWEYYTDEQIPGFKDAMKSCVRTSITCGIGYAKLGFQRQMQRRPDAAADIADDTLKVTHLERLAQEQQDGDKTTDDAEAEELRLGLQQLKAQPELMVREGMVVDFPFPTAIIPDPQTICLKRWVGADFVAEEVFLTPDEVKEIYQIDVSSATGNTRSPSSYTPYSTANRDYRNNPRVDIKEKRKDMVCVWVLWYRPIGLELHIADGYCDFLQAPKEPDAVVEQFFPVYPLTFNELSHPTKIFPPSDVRIMSFPQDEINRARQGMREHRRAARPGYLTPAGMLSEEDEKLVANRPAHALVKLNALLPGQKAEEVFQAFPVQGIDPNLYQINEQLTDIYLSVGQSESGLGVAGDATATGEAIAESSRNAVTEAEVDDLNEFLSTLAADFGSVMLMNLTIDTVREIAGDGAIWPVLTRSQIVKEISLDIVAGSNGRPNKAVRQQAMERLAPILLQVPGLNPMWVIRQIVGSIDDTIDVDEAILPGMASITSQNAMASKAFGAPAAGPGGQAAPGGGPAPQPQLGAPQAQGMQGAMNAPQPQRAGGSLPPGGTNNGMGQRY